MRLLGNLDCEARWAGVALPGAVQQRISLYATLFAACAPMEGEEGAGERHEIWVPAPIDPARLVAHPGWTPPQVRAPDASRTGARVRSRPAPRDPADDPPGDAPGDPPSGAPRSIDPRSGDPRSGDPRSGDPRSGDPPSIDLAWADPAARAANDRGGTLAIAQELGVALPGARIVASLAELDAHLAAPLAAALDAHLVDPLVDSLAAPLAAHVAGFAGRPWIVKARWTAAGRDRARGTGDTLAGELRARIARMLARFGPLVFEPWLDRVADLGVCGEVTAGGEVRLREPHGIVTDPRGGFLGIELSPPIDRAIAASLCAVAAAAAARVAAQTGYRGRFAIDAFVYRDPGTSAHRLHPLCELNARHSFGWIAWALAQRLGIRRLGFDPPPPGATVLIAPGDDRVTAWCA